MLCAICEYAVTAHISVLLSAKIRTGRREPFRRLQVEEGYLHYQRLWEDNVNIHGKSVTMGSYVRHADERANGGATVVVVVVLRVGRESCPLSRP